MRTRLLKTLCYRFVSTCGTLLICYVWTGRFLLSAGVALTSVVVKSFLYYAFDYLWEEEKVDFY